METRLHKLVELPDYVTLAGAAAAILAMFAAIEQRFTAAALLMLVSVTCDYCDGKVARAVKRRHSEFGAALDTVSDGVAFGAAPVVFGYCLGLDAWPAVAALLLFAAAAILRLARFLALPYCSTHFAGMPVPYNSIFLALAYFALSGFASESLIVPAFVLLYLGLAALMISRIRWIKF